MPRQRGAGHSARHRVPVRLGSAGTRPSPPGTRQNPACQANTRRFCTPHTPPCRYV
ncbi:hypothetical protein ART_4065 [Arthrobacter sp. PAMC 25486]|nr:hypothetical protein ART_4065 [Arthrobacter sp. PAMC 25486]